MAGESYGGRYIPVFAAEVYDQNTKLVEAGLTPINLTSVMIGNGITDFATMMLSYYDMACTPASLPPILDISTCVQMKAALPRCEKWLKEGCIEQFDKINCDAAASFCNKYLVDPFFSTDRNPYDISRACDGPISDTLCYPVTKHIAAYLDRPEVRTLLGVDTSAITRNFSSCSNKVGHDFSTNLDEYHAATQHYIAALLERNINVLIYVGKYDWICNHVGNEAWTLALEWSGHEEFSAQSLRDWKIDGRSVGTTRCANGLTFATIEGAGHMVPYDKPKEALELVNRWLRQESL